MDEGKPGSRPAECGDVHFLLAAGIPAIGMMALAKAFAAGTWQWPSAVFPLKLAIIAWHDLIFLIGWSALGFVGLKLASRARPARRVMRRAYVILTALIVFYAIASAPIYLALRMPLSYPLLMMANPDARSSIAPYLTPYNVAALVGGPLLYLLSVRALLRWRRLSRRSTSIAVATAVVVYGVVGYVGYLHWYASGPNEALALNPHWVIAETAFDAWMGGSKFLRTESAPPSYRADFLTFGQREPDAPKAPIPSVKNVLVIVLESTSTQFLGVYHGGYATTPNLEAEAANSLIFHNFYSNAGYTLKSYLPIVLSIYPGVGWEVYSSSHPHLAGESAAQALHDRGYRTAYLTGGMLEFRGSRGFFDNRGFDVIRGCEDFQRAGVGTMVSSWGMDDPPVFDALFDWIGQAPDKPFYAIVWTQQTHHPYALAPYQHAIDFPIADPLSSKGKLLNLYLNDLRIADQQLGRVFAFLRNRKLADDTLVVITGDHGEGFGFPHPWMFHGTALYQESVNVPCIFWNPRAMAGRGNSGAVGAHVDLNPTLFGLLGFQPPASWQGHNLFDSNRADRAYFCSDTGNLLTGLREGRHKFIYNMTLAREELYDLGTDRDEQTNIASQFPAACEEYRRRLSSWASFEREHFKTLITSKRASAK
jgi:arylsulfatase A-like enzyme